MYAKSARRHLLEEININNESILHLPTHLPIRRDHPRVPLDAVRSVSDLPPYLFMGALDESSFHCDASGWSATWQRNEDTWFRIEFDAKDACIHVREQWFGCDGFYSCMHDNQLGRLAQMRFMTPVKSWEEKAETVLQANWNLKYLTAQEGDWMMAGIPDGLMKTLLMPLPIEVLPKLVETFIAFRDDSGMDFPVSGYVLPVMGTVNYVEGKNPEWASESAELFMQTFVATGFPPTAEPVREKANDGTAAWTVRRITCMAFIGVPFVGLIPLLERLEQAGLLARGPMQSDDEQPGLGSVEFSACVVPVGKEFELESVAWWPQDRQRRVFWLLPEDHMAIYQEHAQHRDAEPEVARDVAKAMARRSREWLQELLDDLAT
jgi:hypothetical protein